MDDRTLARSVAFGRVLFGLLMLFAPHRILARTGEGEAAPGMLVWLARSFGIRDIALGAGALVELSDPEPDARWVTAGAVCDTADAAAAVVWHRELGAVGTAATLSLAVPAAAAGWKAASGLRPV
ncbi:MAG: hypothetical protein GY812_00755 [Actinomycetia bacterium]|nr:hypothetical protein [Actinomycetes bacterium]